MKVHHAPCSLSLYTLLASFLLCLAERCRLVANGTADSGLHWAFVQGEAGIADRVSSMLGVS